MDISKGRQHKYHYQDRDMEVPQSNKEVYRHKQEMQADRMTHPHSLRSAQADNRKEEE